MKPALPSVDDRLIWDIQLASLWYPAVTASDEIGLFAALAEAPGDPAELAGRLGASPRALTIVLELLASLGLVAQELGRYQLTAVARHFLVPSSPYYWGGVLRSAARRGGVNFHNDFVTAFRKPDDSADNNAGLIAWETGEMSPELARGIAAYMQSHSAAEAVGVAHNADFTGVTRLLDVGGGSGCFAIALAQTHSEMRCTVMDLGPMCTVAADYIARAGIGDRVDTVAVDMFR
ncbi:MAG TPA: methyltransferase, partial [Stellaceae bacterium]|nr:methyltransferase [Stellaceae bacterium]